MSQYTQNQIKKAVELSLEKVRENENLILFHVKSSNSDKHKYKITYDKLRDEINCECQMFTYTRKCSHSLKALGVIKGKDYFWEEIDKKLNK